MKKTLYSLMLSDDVVREVDALAHRLGTNRSNLINQILADYVSVTTPERRISDIFHAVEQMLAPSRDLVPFFAPNALTMSLKSSLEYKYRPTVKYEVQLFPLAGGLAGRAVGGVPHAERRPHRGHDGLLPPVEAHRGQAARAAAVASRSTTRSMTASSCAASPCRAGATARPMT